MLNELTQIAAERSPEKRVELLRRVTDLYIDGLGQHTDAENYLFDDIMTKIVDRIPREDKIHTAVHLSALPDAPRGTMVRLAKDEDFDVARPVLQGSTALTDDDLVRLAASIPSHHLTAIAARSTLVEKITDVLVERGDRNVALALSANHGARFSEGGMSQLIGRSADDVDLQVLLVDRPDLSEKAITKLLPLISQKLAEKLAERGYDVGDAVAPEFIENVRAQFKDALRERRDDIDELSRMIESVRAGKLTLTAAIETLAFKDRLVDIAAVVSAMADLERNQTFAILAHSQMQSVLVLLRSLDLPWTTVHKVLALRSRKLKQPYAADELQRDYAAIELALAQRVIRFLKVRQSLRGKPEASSGREVA